MMKVQYQGENAQKASEVLKLSDLYGGLLLQNRHPVLKTFLEKEKLIYTGIKENLEKQPASEKSGHGSQKCRIHCIIMNLHYSFMYKNWSV